MQRKDARCAVNIAQHQDHSNTQGKETCPRCGTIARPTLVPGSGVHAIRAECSKCGRFFRWVSVLSPTERLVRKMKARLQAMQAHPPSAAQLALLQALGDTATVPETMAEASKRIDSLKRKSVAR